MVNLIYFLLFFLTHSIYGSILSDLEHKKYDAFFSCIKEEIAEEKNSLRRSKSIPGTQDYFNFLTEINKISDLLEEDKEKPSKKTFRNLLASIRRSIKTKHYQKNYNSKANLKEILFIQKLCYALYTQNKIKKEYKILTEKMGKLGGYSQEKNVKEDNSALTLAESLKVIEERVKQTNDFQKALKKSRKFFQKSISDRFKDAYNGAVSWAHFDPLNSRNIPYHKFTLSKDSESNERTKFIRMGTPTINNDVRTQIAPEFMAYLHYLKRIKKNHTYVNLQDAREVSFSRAQSMADILKSLGLNSEIYRVAALHSLSRQKNLQGTIEVLTLSKDSNFYKQTSPFNQSSNKKIFLKEYFTCLFKSYQGYILPKSWTKKQSQKRRILENKLKVLLKVFFKNQTILNCDEKRFFLDMSYLVIIDMAQENSDLMNITCKDGIDRAGSLHGLMYLFLSTLNLVDKEATKGNLEKNMNKLLTILFSDALSTKKREIVHSRFNSFYNSSLYLLKRLRQDQSLLIDLDLLFKFRKISSF